MNSAITIGNLTYRYPDGTEALRAISFEIGEGESVALMGPNGAGKTTLFLHLNGLLPKFSRYEKPSKSTTFEKSPHPPLQRGSKGAVPFPKGEQEGYSPLHEDPETNRVKAMHQLPTSSNPLQCPQPSFAKGGWGDLGSAGVVKIFGSVMDGKKSLRQIRRRVGIVFQNPEDQLFCPTVFDDVAFGPLNYGLPPGKVKSRVRDALKAVGMSEFEDRVPHHLSFGEKKRVSLATVLSMNPDIILMDEPTSNLDPRGRRKVIEVIGNLNITKVIATHDLEMALELCERGIILDSGYVVADGRTLDILKDRNLLEAHGLEVPYSLR